MHTNLHLPASDAYSQFFTSFTTSSVSDMRIWTKPPGIFNVFICVVGAGGGGGGGFSRTAGTAGGGGGGGGSGGISTLIIDASFLPDLLYIQPGGPGQSGAAGGTGGSGRRSLVSVAPSGATSDLVLASGSGTTGGGGGGTGSAAGAAGAAAGVMNSTGCALATLGLFTTSAGRAGIIGGAQTGAVGGDITFASPGTTGGAGGAGCTTTDFAGGSCLGAAPLYPTIAGGSAGTGIAGNPGIFNLGPIYSLSGGGGGSNNAGVGGAGGSGGFGSGGGGGGAGTTGGIGGAGGPGLVYICCW